MARPHAEIRISPRDVVLEVVDVGGITPGAAAVVGGACRGIAGMRERVRTYGEEIDVGPTADGFRVFARIPVAASVVSPR